MGHKKDMNKINVQKNLLKEIFIKVLETNLAIMRFQLSLTKVKKEQQGIQDIINKSEKAMQIINDIDHYEILVSLYNTFICHRETFFVTICATINKENTIEKWDKSEEGFQEFLELEQKAIEKNDQEIKEKMETAKIIKDAKAQGKKVELMYIDGKVKPVIVEEKPN